METKKIYPVLTIILFLFGIIISGIMGYSFGLRKVRFVTERQTILPKVIYGRAGEATKIEEDIIYLKAGLLTGEINPATGEAVTETLKISVDSNTEFILNVEGPENFAVEEGTFQDIKVGSTLDISSIDNIKNKKEFLASQIIIYNLE